MFCFRPGRLRRRNPRVSRLGAILGSAADYATARILRLEHCERFVFVMSVLEKYSDQDCSVLLGCSRQDVGETRMRALRHLAEPDRLRTVAPSGRGSSDPEEAETPEVQLEPQF